MSVRRRHDIQKGLRDYLVPIVGGILIIILIFSVFSGDNTPQQVDLENKIGLALTLDSLSTESYIEYPGNFKKKIEGDISLYKGEKVIVKDGSVSLDLFGSGDFKLNKLGELKYLENGDFSLLSSDLWLNSTLEVNLQMRFAGVSIGENTNISFSQNEMGSTIYLINGFAEITNLAGKSTVLDNGQKITVSRLDANNKDVDLALLKENIDDYYKRSDWFIKNNGNSFFVLDENDNKKTGTGVTIPISIGKRLLNLTNLSDESNVSSDSIIVEGSFTDLEITKILLNGVEADINKELKTFKIENVSVPNKENDLVFKVYDDSNDLLSKFIYVVYYNGGSISNNSISKFNVTTFDVDGSQFIFTTIKDGITKQLLGKTSYTTYGDFLTIYGQVSAKAITKVSVNGYTLNSYNGNTWRYHPSITNDNLSVGTNVYEVKYYNEEGKVVYTNHFTIIKKKVAVVEEKVEDKKIEKISNEVKIN